MFKVVGIILIVFASYLCGNSMAIRLSNRAKALKSVAQLCRFAAEKIRLFATPVEKILCEAQSQYAELEFLCGYPEILPDYPFNAVERETIKAFFCGLGASDVCGQVKYCEGYALQFERMASDVKAQCDGKNKLYRVLGLFCGICIAVILV